MIPLAIDHLESPYLASQYPNSTVKAETHLLSRPARVQIPHKRMKPYVLTLSPRVIQLPCRLLPILQYLPAHKPLDPFFVLRDLGMQLNLRICPSFCISNPINPLRLMLVRPKQVILMVNKRPIQYPPFPCRSHPACGYCKGVNDCHVRVGLLVVVVDGYVETDAREPDAFSQDPVYTLLDVDH